MASKMIDAIALGPIVYSGDSYGNGDSITLPESLYRSLLLAGKIANPKPKKISRKEDND